MKSSCTLALIFFLILSWVSLSTCRKVPAPVIDKIEVISAFEYSDRSTATITGVVKSNAVSSIIERGVCWDSISNPTLKSRVVSVSGDTGFFSVNITGLTQGKIYYAKAYVRNATQTVYGNEISFSTKAPPTITVEPASNISYQSATIIVKINGQGTEPITQKGLCWNTTGSPTLSNDKTEHGAGDGEFISKLENLKFGTKYYVRVYVVTSFGTEFGSEFSFTTAEVNLPTITTAPVVEIAAYSAQSGGIISNDGGAPILKRGVCWNFIGNPIPDITSPYQTNDGSGSGAFTSSLQSLYPFSWYGVRAYATNVAGTAYGQTVTFNTSSVAMPGPSLLTPANNALIKCCNVSFTWGASVYAEFYTLQVSKSALFEGTLITANVGCADASAINSDNLLSTIVYGTSYCLKMNDSTQNGTWYWRVRFFGAGTFSAWSAPRAFIFEK
jgi:hypothetical protein